MENCTDTHTFPFRVRVWVNTSRWVSETRILSDNSNMVFGPNQIPLAFWLMRSTVGPLAQSWKFCLSMVGSKYHPWLKSINTSHTSASLLHFHNDPTSMSLWCCCWHCWTFTDWWRWKPWHKMDQWAMYQAKCKQKDLSIWNKYYKMYEGRLFQRTSAPEV